MIPVLYRLSLTKLVGNLQLQERDTFQYRFQLEHIFVPRPASNPRVLSDGRPRRNGIRHRNQ
jgi:hypothetical protein